MNIDQMNRTSQVAQTQAEVQTKQKSSVNGSGFDAYLKQTGNDTKEVSLNELFQKAADTYGVSVDLLKAIGYAESGFRPNATSHCGAQGIMQLMPATAKSLGVTDAYNPEQNIMGGAKHISSMLKKYNGNISLALAAYNTGSGNVAKYGGIPPFKETQNYVVKVTKYMQQGVDADRKVVLNTNSYQPSGVSSENSYTPVFENVDETQVRDLESKWNEIFSYDDYEMLLRILNEDEDSQEENQQNSNMTQIQMRPNVAALLRSAAIK